MHRMLVTTLAVAASLWIVPASAHDYRVAQLGIDHPYARATPPGADIAGAWLTLRNDGKTPDRLIAASSPAATRVELHTMAMENNVMKMREVDAIDLPPGSTVTLKPGALHLMMIGLKKPLAEGSKVPLTLDFEHAGSVNVELAVEGMGAGMAMH